MKNEIEKAQDKQKRNRQGPARSTDKVMTGFSEIKPDPKPETKEEHHDSTEKKAVQKAKEPKFIEESKVEVFQHINNKPEGPSIIENSKEEKLIHKSQHNDESYKEAPEFRVDTVEKELDVLKNPESPRPAPPVFDDNFESDVIFSKEERAAKEKEALEIAQKIVYEQKIKEEKEIGEKKQALNQLENKFDNIASKYLKDKK